jgi:lipopolysaccharide export system protein LptC
VSQIDKRSAPAFDSMGRTDTQQVFRAAKRHSRFVRLLRLALPAGVVFGAAGIMILTALDPLRALAKLPVNIDSLTVSGSKITMHQPRVAGLTQDKRPYVLTARAAAQDVTNPDVLELHDLRATTEMKDAGAVEISAQNGTFETKADRLTLRRNIVVKSPQYQANLAEAVVNTRTNHIVSDKAVEVTTAQGKITANRLEIMNSGEIVRFERGVVMVITSDGSRSSEVADAK